jgi:fused signal recognition particle receptor
MSRRFKNVMAATVFVVAFYALIPTPSGADFTATTQAEVSITIQIPESAPDSAVTVEEQSEEDPVPASPAEQEPAQQPSQDGTPTTQPDLIVAPSIPEVVVPTPVVTPEPAPVVVPEPPAPVEQIPPQEPAPIEPESPTQEPSASPEPEGLPDEEVSP